MRIEFAVSRLEVRDWIVGGVALLWLLVSLLGYGITRQMPETHWLTRNHWKGLHVHRQTRHDLQRLDQDLQQLVSLSRRAHPDPVQTLTLAQRIYYRHRTGAVTTTVARHALIQAAEMAVQTSYGARERWQLTVALQDADTQLQRLRSP